MTWTKRISNFLELIKFNHTIFALPFALISMLVAARGLPTWETGALIVLCMVSARTAAMAFNRFCDWEFDRKNPRTQNRAKLATRPLTLGITLGSLALFVWGAGLINALCLALSPAAIVLVLGYSLTKRFTAYSHAFLGLALSAAPMGAWAAVTGRLDSPAPYVLAAAVWAWVFGFDLIYATLDAEFDRRAGLHSFPSRFGTPATLRLAQVLHGLTWLILAAFGALTKLGLAYGGALAVVAAALIYEHVLSRHADVQKINRAFFHMNALVSLVLLLGVIFSLWNKF